MRKLSKLSYILLAGFIIISLSGCTQKVASDNSTNISTKETKSTNQIDDKRRIVTLSPPIFSMLVAKGVADDVIGVSPRSFAAANMDVIKLVSPNHENINTSFVGQDFKVNIESLMNLDPTLILYYGKFQGEGLDKIDIPVIQLKGDNMSPEELTIFWDNQLSEVLNLKHEGKMEKAWTNSKEIISKNTSSQELKGLYILSNSKEIQVSSANSYGNEFMKMIGIKNVAENLEGFNEGAGQATVSMEQIHEWNPDIIFISEGSDATDIIENKITGQNWDGISAVTNKQVFKIPVGIYNWGMPSADSPLMPIWMAHCVSPENISKEILEDSMKKHYKDIYNVDLTNEIITSILGEN